MADDPTASLAGSLLAATSVRTGDLVHEAWSAIAQRPLRSILTCLAVFIGTTGFAIVVSLSATVSAQISEDFDLLRATEVRLHEQEQPSDSETIEHDLPTDVDERLGRLAGTKAGGAYWVMSPTPAISALAQSAYEDRSSGISLIGATPGAVGAASSRIIGRNFDQGHMDRQSNVVLVGAAAARKLQLAPTAAQPWIFIEGVPFAVIGTIDTAEREPAFLASIVMPGTTSLRLDRAAPQAAVVLVETEAGAAQQVAAQAPTMLRPHAPETFLVSVAPDPRQLRATVETETRNLFITLALLSIAVGTIGIANASLIAVTERRSEIGLRRALGARARHIASQIVIEAALLGGVAGLLGLVVALLVTATISVLNNWTPTSPGWLTAIAPALGVISGVIAGLQPAVHAARVTPSSALRS